MFLTNLILNNSILSDLNRKSDEMEGKFQFTSEIIDGTFKFIKIEQITSDPENHLFERYYKIEKSYQRERNGFIFSNLCNKIHISYQKN